MNENDLVQRLMVSKKIMDRHNQIPRSASETRNINEAPALEEFEAPVARYNLPTDLVENVAPVKKMDNMPLESKINNSRLPDEIKKLMLEHPINQPNPMSPANTVLSDNIIEAATRLMGNNKETKPEVKKNIVKENLDVSSLIPLIKEAVREILKENNLIVESENKTNELFTFRVGSHVFEGKINKIKKIK